jgi:hypothetical protein
LKASLNNRLKKKIHSFLASAVDGGEWWASRPGRFTPGIKSPVPTEHEAGWAPSRSGGCGENKNFALSGIEPRFLGCLTHSLVAIPAEVLGSQRSRMNVCEWMIYLSQDRGQWQAVVDTQ